MEKTMFRCGLCGELKDIDDVIIIGEIDFPTITKDKYTALPAHSRPVHNCGLLAIRCLKHPNARRNARQAIYRHLKRLLENGYVYNP